METLLQARRSFTNSLYQKIWQSFLLVAQQLSWNPVFSEVTQVLNFLQMGLNKGLSSNTIKVQPSALSAMTGVKWAVNTLVIQFMRACQKEAHISFLGFVNSLGGFILQYPPFYLLLYRS